MLITVGLRAALTLSQQYIEGLTKLANYGSLVPVFCILVERQACMQIKFDCMIHTYIWLATYHMFCRSVAQLFALYISVSQELLFLISPSAVLL